KQSSSLSAWAVPAAPDSGYAGARAACRSHTGAVVTPADVIARPGGARRTAADGAPQKTLPLAVIVVGLDNIAYSRDYDWNETIFTGERSVAAYYEEMSFGSFTFSPVAETSAYGAGGNVNAADRENDGVIHVTLPEPHRDWTLEERTSEADYRMIRMLAHALEQASDFMDFAAYDGNSDGAITTNELAVAFVIAGYEAALGDSFSQGGPNYYLWSHAWSIDEAIGEHGWTMTLPRLDGVELSSYIAIAERLDAARQEPIGLLAHELGHYLGLPDLYPTAGGGPWSAYQVHFLSLMASGAWCEDGNGSYQPCALDAWSRCALGWHMPIVAERDGVYAATAENGTGGYAAMKIPTQRAEEYYLVENRQPVGWDCGLRGVYSGAMKDCGLIFWHVDEGIVRAHLARNSVNNPDHRPGVMPLYPESVNGEPGYLGAASTVRTGRPFLGPAEGVIDLPLYGGGAAADQRGARFASGLRVTVQDPSGPVIRLELDTAQHAHLLQYEPAQPPACETDGRAAVWRCAYCGALFADAAGAEPTVEAALRLPAPGHTEPDPHGNCTRCGAHLIDLCPWCGRVHGGGFDAVQAWFHQLFWRIRAARELLFNRKS
ncbi:MAG: M6 family metalloprotease domain-containing protein, partial [Clostridia bacterium]|nr:M6 family metalloprotease domain-containing protein [Clostridia bacterium]